jgi:hypothetical protein
MTMESIRSRLFSPRLSRTGTIARFTLLEAWGTRLPWLWAAVLACIWAASLFVRQIAITESERLQWSFYASGVRLGAVLTLALYITSSMVREFNEKGLEMVLALDLSRGFYVAGKVAAFLALGVFLALAAGSAPASRCRAQSASSGASPTRRRRRSGPKRRAWATQKRQSPS